MRGLFVGLRRDVNNSLVFDLNVQYKLIPVCLIKLVDLKVRLHERCVCFVSALKLFYDFN